MRRNELWFNCDTVHHSIRYANLGRHAIGNAHVLARDDPHLLDELREQCLAARWRQCIGQGVEHRRLVQGQFHHHPAAVAGFGGRPPLQKNDPGRSLAMLDSRNSRLDTRRVAEPNRPALGGTRG
jgi:hypothetical protein